MSNVKFTTSSGRDRKIINTSPLCDQKIDIQTVAKAFGARIIGNFGDLDSSSKLKVVSELLDSSHKASKKTKQASSKKDKSDGAVKVKSQKKQSNGNLTEKKVKVKKSK